MTASQTSARGAFLEIKAAMMQLNRPATAAEIAELSGIPLLIVTRRLQSNGLANMTPAFAWFARGANGWSLTQRGREME